MKTKCELLEKSTFHPSERLPDRGKHLYQDSSRFDQFCGFLAILKAHEGFYGGPQ
jgi:hypothetical protein